MLINFHTVQKVNKTHYNLGDLVCSPFRFYDFSTIDSELVEADLESNLKQFPPEANIIIGGGGILLHPAIDRITNYFKGKKILWGVGDTHLKSESDLDCFDLIGTRDFNDERYLFVPCVTCKSSFLDIVYPKTRYIVGYCGHKRNMRLDPEIPIISTLVETDQKFSTRLSFIASAEKYVITSSYHGAYWSLLLHKTTVMYAVGPLFKKFKTLKYYEPKYGMLEEFRNYNDKFFTLVKNLLS